MRYLSALWLMFCCWNLPAQAQVVDRVTAHRLGLETAWLSQVQLPQTDKGLASTHLWADPSNARQYAIVELPARTIRIAADTPDRNGDPIGLEEAKSKAQQYAARLLGKSDGFEVVEATIPKINMVCITSDGLVQNLDAETGQLLWSATCGSPRAPAFPGAVSAYGVAVVHGLDLHVLDWKSGKHKMIRRLRSATSNAVGLCNDLAFVSDFGGRVETYGLGEPLRPWTYVMSGHVVGSPVTLSTNDFLAMATDNGYVYVYKVGDPPEIYIRYESTAPITGSLAAGNGAFYVGTSSGLLSKFSVSDRLGRIEWEYRSGGTKTNPAIVIEDTVYIASETGKLVALNDQDGFERWAVPGRSIEQPISVTSQNLLAISRANELVGFEKASGRYLGSSIPLNLSEPIVNTLTDRVYLVSKSGQIQCLRPIDAELPTLNTPMTEAEEKQPDGTQPPDNSGMGNESFGTSPFDNAGGGAGNPFGGDAAGSNPFGGDSGDANPFGGDSGGSNANPFGGGSGSDGANPFGGGGSGDGANPFGTGGN